MEKKKLITDFVLAGVEVDFDPARSPTAFNAALAMMLSSEKFCQRSFFERAEFLARFRPQRGEGFSKAREAWRFAVSEVVKEMDLAGYPNLVPREFRHVAWAQAVASREPQAETWVNIAGYVVRLFRLRPVDQWFAALYRAEDFEDFARGHAYAPYICNNLYLKTGHLSSRSLEMSAVHHLAQDGEIITVIVRDDGRERGILPAAMDFYRRGGGWRSTPWRVGVMVSEAREGPQGSTRVRQGDLILEAYFYADVSDVLPIPRLGELEHHRVFWGDQEVPPVIRTRGQIGFVSPLPVQVHHPEHVTAVLGEGVGVDRPVFIWARPAHGKTQYVPRSQRAHAD